MVLRPRWHAALYHPPRPRPKGKQGPTPQGQAPTPFAGLGRAFGYPLGNCGSHLVQRPAEKNGRLLAHRLVVHPPIAPVEIHYVLVADLKGKLGMEAFLCTDLQASPEQILDWVVMRWSVEVTFDESRAHLGLMTQRRWADQTIARTTPVLLVLFSLVTVLALKLSHDEQIPVPVSAWYRKDEPTFADRLALVRRHLWRARYLVNSTSEAEVLQWPREGLER